ncbi:MAG TPA: response regulator [Longimicrobium sp.]
MAEVLLVEDTPDNRHIYHTILAWAGHTVHEECNGEDALKAVRICRPAVIVMDVTMPVMNGLEATRRLKADPETAGIPVLILTAHAYPSDRADAVSAGADAYLSKPCAPKALLAEVERLLTSGRRG